MFAKKARRQASLIEGSDAPVAGDIRWQDIRPGHQEVAAAINATETPKKAIPAGTIKTWP